LGDTAAVSNNRITGFPYLEAQGAPLAFAHRGGAKHPEIKGLENSLRAFRHAHTLGYRYLETDVHLTSDGVLMAFHDNELSRVTDSVGVVSSLTAAELSTVKIGGSEPIPTFVELLEGFPDCYLNIDIKADNAVEPLARLIQKRAAQYRVLVGSFSRKRLQQFRLLAPEVPTSASPFEAAMLRFVPFRTLANWFSGRQAVAVQVPRYRGRIEVVTESFVRRMHALGKHVHVWTIDEPSEMHLLLDRGVDGLMTDRTDILKAVLQERGQWKEDR
jgi:glycerophosphoryl diester phosphodiesterase